MNFLSFQSTENVSETIFSDFKLFFKYPKISSRAENFNRVMKFVIEIFFINGDRKIVGDRCDGEEDQQ